MAGTTRRILVSGFLKYVLENRARPERVAERAAARNMAKMAEIKMQIVT
ncbi:MULTISPECIES: hypothetical protein [Roseovarius]|nr:MULTISPECIES: hypothetical protein [unclassified Roseovarius]